MLRSTVLSVVLVACVARARAADADDATVEWLKQEFPDNEQNKDNGSLPSDQGKETANDVDNVVNWVKDIIPTDSETTLNNTKKKVNLDPSNIKTPCISDDGKTGVCVHYYLCDVNTRKVIKDGTHLIDIRVGSTDRDCPHYLDVCCQLEDRVIVEGDFTPLAPDASNIDPKRQLQCGWSNPVLLEVQTLGEGDADRGVYASYGEFPWMVALLRKSGTKVWAQNDYIGGGSLIHPSVVMTAYHKLLKITAEELKCRAGEWDTQTDREQYKIQERDADRFVSHPDFYRTSLYNDVALIFLKKPFELAGAPHIGTACLAPVLPDNATCFSMGWGKDAQDDADVHILKKVRLSLVPHQTCETLLHTHTRFRHIPQFALHASLTCAGGEEYVDTCQGDGGSPLVCTVGEPDRDGRTRYAVVGMVAYGLACGAKNVPGVYVNVPHLYPWVQQQMAASGYTDDTYSFGSTGRDCPHYQDVCFQLEDRVIVEGDVTPLAPDASNIDPKRQLQCGWSNPDLLEVQTLGEGDADRGVYASYGEFPWMVALLRKSGTTVWAENDYMGGGSLIHPSVVMTAYHKLLKITAEELKCRAGEWDTQTEKEPYKIQERDADRFVSHPDFYRTSLYNDVALIFLKKPFELAGAPHIGTACLSPVLPDTATCFSMGWGKDAQDDADVHKLRKVRLSLVPHQTCETLLHTHTRFRHIPQFALHASLTCAGGEEYVDTCQGDGGSPLVCTVGEPDRDGRTRYAVVGIVAYGLACGAKNVPGVYVNVPHLYPWVQQQMAASGYTDDTYSY